MEQPADVSPWKAPHVWCVALYALFYAVLLVSWPALPAQDASAWVMEGALLHGQLSGHAAPGCVLVDALPPNAFAQVAIAGLMTVLSAELAGRVYMALCVIALCAALLYLTRARSLALLVVLPLCASYPLYHGFLNYMAALPVLCFALAALLRNPEARGARGLALLVIVPCVLYSCHGTALAVWGVLVAVQCWVRRSWQLTARAAVGFIPVLLLLALYVSQRSAEGAAVTWSAGSFLSTLSYRLRSPLRFFSVFHGLAPTYDDRALRVVAPLLVAVNLAYALWLCASGLRWAVRARVSMQLDERFLACSTLVLSVCFLVLPHDVAKMLNPAERLLLPAAIIGAAGRALAAPRAATTQRARVWLYLLSSTQALYALMYGTHAARAAADLIEVRQQYGFDAPVVQARQLRFAAPAPALGGVDLLPRHQVLAMQGILEEFQTEHLVAPFDTGLFRCAVHDQNNPSGWDLDEWRRHAPQPVIVLGEREHTRVLADQFGSAFTTMKVGTGFILLQRTAAMP